MPTHDAQRMTEKLHATIPLCAFMQLQLHTLTTEEAVAQAPLTPNRNLHGTAFAGAQYALAVATGWALVQHRLETADIQGELVIRDGQIRYRRPVSHDLQLRAQLMTAADVASVRQRVLVRLTSGEKECAEFSGTYVVVRPSPD